jgi:hypothetical protein
MQKTRLFFKRISNILVAPPVIDSIKYLLNSLKTLFLSTGDGVHL